MNETIVAIIGLLTSAIGAGLPLVASRPKKRKKQARRLNVRLDWPVIDADRESAAHLEVRPEAVSETDSLQARLSSREIKQLTETFRQELREELRREGRRTFWLGFAQGAFFFALGVGVTLLFS
jgi:hypothetical protein